MWEKSFQVCKTTKDKVAKVLTYLVKTMTMMAVKMVVITVRLGMMRPYSRCTWSRSPSHVLALTV